MSFWVVLARTNAWFTEFHRGVTEIHREWKNSFLKLHINKWEQIQRSNAVSLCDSSVELSVIYCNSDNLD